MTMQALILAGGLGIRLRSITSTMPKPMVPILGKPFLEYQLELLKNSGITDVVLSVGYLGHKIADYFGDGSRIGLRITYSLEQAPMGTGGGVKLASHLLSGEFFVVYGDSYLPVDFRKVKNCFMASGRIALVVAYDNSSGDANVPCNISVNGNSLVTGYEKDSTNSNLTLVEAGVLVFKKRLLDLIPEGRPVSLENEVFPVLIARKELVCFVTSQRFYDIGLPDRLREFGELFK